jgi:serine/threonine protein kinase
MRCEGIQSLRQDLARLVSWNHGLLTYLTSLFLSYCYLQLKNDQFKLGDFGLVSKIAYHNDVEEGDSRYMSMELLSGDHGDLTKSDIFSLGISLYEVCLDGKPLPTDGDVWQALRSASMPPLSNVPEEMQRTMRLMMNPTHTQRPTASDLLKRPQLLSDEQKALVAEKNKVLQANLALVAQERQLRMLAPKLPTRPRKGLLVRANTWNGG